MALPQQQHVSEADYLAFEREAATKHEYVRGQVIAMAGANEAHVLICGNIATALNLGLRDRVYQSDLQVKAASAPSYRYPDVAVVCGEPTFADETRRQLLNPTALVEVVSDSTRTTDFADKLNEYRSIPSVSAYLIVEQTQPEVHLYSRHPDGWLLTSFRGLEASLALLGVPLPLGEIYRNVDG